MRASRYVVDLDEQRGFVNAYGRYVTVDNPFVRVDLGRSKTHFVRVVISARRNACEDLAHFRFIVDESQQRLPPRACATDAEHVFGGRVQVNDQEVVIEQDNARGQAVQNANGVFLQCSGAGAATV